MKKILSNKVASYTISIILTIISACIMAIGLNTFISPNGFLSTGATGVAIIIGRLYDILVNKGLPVNEKTITGILIFVFNIPILILAWTKLSKKFAILTAINVIVNSVTLTLLPKEMNEWLHLAVPANITFLDAALFVGIVNGFGNALAYIAGGSTGGIDVLSMYYSLKRQCSIGKITTLFNGVILIGGLIVTMFSTKLIDNNIVRFGNDSIKLTFYTLIYLVIASMIIDLFYIRNKRTILFITTSNGHDIAHEINEKFVRGVTILDAKGGYTGNHKDFIYCACSSFEVVEIIKTVKSIDEHAFVSVVEASKVHGNFLSKELR